MSTTTISGTTDVEDALIRSSSGGGNPNNNHGAYGDIDAIHGSIWYYEDYEETYYAYYNFQTRAMIRCTQGSLSGISGTISAFRLKVKAAGYMAGTGNTTKVKAYVLKDAADWIEGTANNTQQSGSCCWNYLAYNSAGWPGSAGASTADTDYISDASPPTIQPSGDDRYAFLSETFTLAPQLASDWKDGTKDDNGLLLISEETGSFVEGTDDVCGSKMLSTENSTPSNNPYWEVDWAAAAGVSAFISRPSPFAPRSIICK